MAKLGDLDIFPLNLGGNVFGWTADRDASFAILDGFAAGGGNFVDTADSYSRWVPGHTGGESETIIGEWMAARGNRDDVVVATKVASHPQFLGLSGANVLAAADASLQRLGTDRIDLYYAHWDNDQTIPIDEIAGAFSALVDQGKVRHIGISNMDVERIDGWFAACEANGLHRPVALQPHYNLMERGYETDGKRAAALRHGLAVFPYYSLAAGFLTGKYRPGAPVEGARAGNAAKYLEGNGPAVLEALDELAADWGVSVTTVALAWLRAQPTVVAPIASASKPGQLPDLLASATLDLTPAEIDALGALTA